MLARNLVCSSTGTIDGVAGRCLGCYRTAVIIFRTQPYGGKRFIVDGAMLGEGREMTDPGDEYLT